jgi:hypothetical protein
LPSEGDGHKCKGIIHRKCLWRGAHVLTLLQTKESLKDNRRYTPLSLEVSREAASTLDKRLNLISNGHNLDLGEI